MADVVFTVTVPFGTGAGYYIDGVQKPIVPVVTGGTFRFNQNDSTNNGHPLILSTTTSTAGIISTGVSYYLDGASNQANYLNTSLFNAASVRYIEITVAQTSDFYYICNVHGSGMGNVMNITYITWGALGWNIGEWGNQGLDVTVDVAGSANFVIRFEAETDVFSAITNSDSASIDVIKHICNDYWFNMFPPYQGQSQRFSNFARNIYGVSRRLQLGFTTTGNPATFTIKTTFRRIP